MQKMRLSIPPTLCIHPDSTGRTGRGAHRREPPSARAASSAAAWSGRQAFARRSATSAARRASGPASKFPASARTHAAPQPARSPGWPGTPASCVVPASPPRRVPSGGGFFFWRGEGIDTSDQTPEIDSRHPSCRATRDPGGEQTGHTSMGRGSTRGGGASGAGAAGGAWWAAVCCRRRSWSRSRRSRSAMGCRRTGEPSARAQARSASRAVFRGQSPLHHPRLAARWGQSFFVRCG